MTSLGHKCWRQTSPAAEEASAVFPCGGVPTIVAQGRPHHVQ
jgi:hypothetical protein